jgi:pimeloyl-ACP methyl ester carboxylesterase
MCWNNSVPGTDGSPRQWSRKPEPSDSKFYRERVTKISCPVLSVWGADFEAVGKIFDIRAISTEMADDLRAEAIEQCGHLPHEEACRHALRQRDPL